MPTTWILAADAARARLFALDDDDAAPRELADFLHPAGRQKASDLLADAPARYFRRGRRDRTSASEPHTPPEQVEEECFARELADELERGRTGNRYERLCIIAPPRFLGRLREAMSKELEKLVSQSVPKDLVALDPASMARYLGEDPRREEVAPDGPRLGTAAYSRRR